MISTDVVNCNAKKAETAASLNQANHEILKRVHSEEEICHHLQVNEPQ